MRLLDSAPGRQVGLSAPRVGRGWEIHPGASGRCSVSLTFVPPPGHLLDCAQQSRVDVDQLQPRQRERAGQHSPVHADRTMMCGRISVVSMSDDDRRPVPLASSGSFIRLLDPVRVAFWAVGVFVALLLSGCTGSKPAHHIGGAQTPGDATSTATSSGGSVARPSVLVGGVARLPDGHLETEIQLRNLPIPVGEHDGPIVGFHPAQAPITFSVMAPPGGVLVVCSDAHGDRTFNAGCSKIPSGSSRTVPVAQADGNSHVAVSLTGTWPTLVSVSEVDVTYEAVDNFLSVDLPG
jgi:hypothetical protein